MRRVICCVLVALLWISGARSEAQTAKIQAEVDKKLEKQRAEQKTALEQLIAEALKNNPDIRVGESKVRDAEAELQRTRMKVLSEITVLHTETQAAQAAVEEAARRYERAKKLFGQKALSTEILDEAEHTFLKCKASLAVIQAKLPYLLGKASPMDRELTFLLRTSGLMMEHSQRLKEAQKTLRLHEESQNDVQLAQQELAKRLEEHAKVAGKAATDEEFLRRLTLDLLGRPPTADEMKDFLSRPEKVRRQKWVEKLAATQPRLETARDYYPMAMALVVRSASPMTDKLRKALDAPVRMQAQGLTAKDLLDHVRDTMLPGVNLHVRAKALKNNAVDINLKEALPLGAFLQYLEDELEVVFVLRDYGVVVVGEGERLPPGAINVIDFWKRGKIAEKPSQVKEKK
jgi:hypothetical protein